MSVRGFHGLMVAVVVGGVVLSGCTTPAGPEGPARDPASALRPATHVDCDSPGDLRAALAV